MSKYTMVDEAYDVTLLNNLQQLAWRSVGLFYEDGTETTFEKTKKFFRDNPKRTLYLYQKDEDGDNRWNRDWYYRVEKH
jgi:hypothetical protein